MKIMAFMGSPRKGSNTETLMDRVIDGAGSKTNVEVEKIYLYDADIGYCTACGMHTPRMGSKECPLKDDMAGILARMQEADAFIFGSPNHGHTISAAMTTFISRLMPLLKMHVVRDDAGKIVHAEARPLIKGKKAVMVVVQGDPTPSSSALILRIFDANFKDFQLRKVGEVFSCGNIGRAIVQENRHDLEKAYNVGVKLATMP